MIDNNKQQIKIGNKSYKRKEINTNYIKINKKRQQNKYNKMKKHSNY